MNRSILVATIIILVAAAALFAVIRQSRLPENGQTAIADNDGAHGVERSNDDSDALIDAKSARLAPALAAGEWINSEPRKLEDLRGRVVLIDFWTFGCYNCRNTLPTLKKFNARYREQGLTIIGVHAPEFERERQLENVRREVKSLGINYPVVTDNDYATWRAYGVNAWPTVVILDKLGRIRYTHIGEGRYEEQERVIQKLLAD